MPAPRTLKRRAPGEDAFQCQMSYPAPPTPSASSSASALGAGPTQTISFAPNITPITYTAPPPGEDDDLAAIASPPSALFPDPADHPPGTHAPAAPGVYQPAAKRRRKGRPGKPVSPSASASASSPSPADPAASPADASSPSAPPDACASPTPAHIPRPPNAFILFRSSFIRSQHVSAATEGNHGTLSKIVGMLWHALSYEERQVWQAKARRALAEHRRMYPGYSFRPAKGAAPRESAPLPSAAEKAAAAKAKAASPAPANAAATTTTKDDSAAPAPAPAKRRTRAVGPRDVARCERIAALLARGLKGAALEAAMREFDATREPERFEARFEAPLTALQFAPGRGAGKREQEEERREGRSAEAEAPKEAPAQETQTRPPLLAARPVQPLRAIRRSSSAPLLDAEQTAAVRRQSTFMPAPSPVSAAPAYAQHHLHEQYVQPYAQQQQQQQQYTEQHGPQQIRQARKRSASSSPPVRTRGLPLAYHHVAPVFPPYQHQQQQPFDMDFHHHQQQQQPYALQIDTNFAHHHQQQQQMYQQSSYSAHPLSRQPTEVLFDGDASASGSQSSGEWGSETSGSSSWEGSGIDFGAFSFANPPPPASASAAGVAASPLEPAPTSSSPCAEMGARPAGMDEFDYAGMPLLVEPPAHHPLFDGYAAYPQQHHQHQQQAEYGGAYHQQHHQHHQHQHTHAPAPLAIQTSWSTADFDFGQGEAVPVSAVPSSAAETGAPTSALEFEYEYAAQPGGGEMYVGAASPAPPSAAGTGTSTGALTPRDDGEPFEPAFCAAAGADTGMDAWRVDVDFGAYLAQAGKLSAAAAAAGYDIGGAGAGGGMGCGEDFGAFARFMGGYGQPHVHAHAQVEVGQQGQVM
ncbi:hypothetical protein DFH11DRAFT_1806405 [Phellopilus nigrolimitatus]|nr:hypothetical protein DFH11DRAFT_1806405 [Phellopilus nigrolimitatus]